MLWLGSLLCDYHDLSMREARPMLLSAELDLKNLFFESAYDPFWDQHALFGKLTSLPSV